jgi:2'-5' RNA ligase
LFVAAPIADEAKVDIAAAVAPWRERFPAARWAPPENWHVTLLFLGQAWPRLVDWIQGQVQQVSRSAVPFQTRVSGLGAFPSPERARVLWAGLDDPGAAMSRIAADLSQALSAEFPPEGRPFFPHLTVARSDPPLRMPEAFAQTGVPSKEFQVRSLVLFRSHIRRPAPWYELLATFPLGGRGVLVPEHLFE